MVSSLISKGLVVYRRTQSELIHTSLLVPKQAITVNRRHIETGNGSLSRYAEGLNKIKEQLQRPLYYSL